MVQVGEWRLIDSEEEAAEAAPAKDEEGPSGPGMRSLVVAMAGVALAGVGLAIWLTMPQGGVQLDIAGQAGQVPVELATDDPGLALAPPSSVPDLVVDVQGAVLRPGVHRLPAGSRVADAIAAAGGYSTQVDIGAAAERLNLAERLSDGAKIRVPERGEAAAAATAPTSSGAPAGGGLVDINHASLDELDTLPGIGPVTAQKIIDTRTELPFATIDDLLSRGVVGASTFEKLRALISATP